MLKLARTAALVSALAFGLAGWAGAGAAQDKTVAVRISNMEDQMRQLYGQIEELSLQVRQLTSQLERMQKDSEYRFQEMEGGSPKKQADAQIPAAGAQDGVVLQAPGNDDSEDGVVQSIEPDNELSAYQTGELDQMASGQGTDDLNGGQLPDPVETAPGPKPLGYIPGSGMNSAPLPNSSSDAGDTYTPNEVETASLDSTSIANATPEQLYERSYESLLRRRYGEAEAGFRTFLERHASHELAGNAEFWLGETYYVQSDYKKAAQAFLTGYQTYPANRKAPDSLLKLGMSLKQLGQKDQACAAFATVGSKFPKAAETLKRAQNESTKAGC